MEFSWFVIVLYVLLMWAYAWHVPKSRATPWNVLPSSAAAAGRLFAADVLPCSTSADCPAHHVCFAGSCVPVLLRGEECDPRTGSWSLRDVKGDGSGKPFAVCTCTHPHLITQKHFGGNCDVDVACGSRGRWNIADRRCDCDVGYAPFDSPLPLPPTCRRETALEVMNKSPCGPDEVRVDQIRRADGFHDDYVRANGGKQCFKRPCTFDALSGGADGGGRPLKHGRYEDGIGCACDPSQGLFGVRLEGAGNYLRGSGYTACASILEREPLVPLEVDVMTYFYMLNRRPASLIRFRDVPLRELKKVFRGAAAAAAADDQHAAAEEATRAFVVGQEWPFDFAQHAFRRKLPYSARTRECLDSSENRYWGSVIHSTTCKEWVYVENRMEYCRDISTELKAGGSDRANYYVLLYGYPACRIEPNDFAVPEQYRGHYVSNPFHMLLKRYPNYERSNGFELSFRNRNGWTLDFAGLPYNLETYSLVTTYVPNVVDEVVEGLESPSVGVVAGDLEARVNARSIIKERRRIRGE